MNTGLIDFLFDTSNWPPRWHCGNWTETLGWVHILSDIAIFLAYTSIPAVLIYWCIKRRDIPFHHVFILFALFIIFCGSGHMVEAIIFWKPVYRFDGLVKLSTAIISWVTVIALLPMIPKVLDFPKMEKINELLKRDLSTSKMRLELSFAGADVGLWDWDIALDQMTFSSFFMQVLGKESKFPQKTYEDFVMHIHPEDRKIFRNSMENHLRKKDPFQVKIRMMVGGKYRWFDARGLAHWDEKGKPVRMAGSFMDVQDVIDAHQKLSKTVSDLQFAKKEMEDFLFVVSHDLRAPLINIKGFSDELSHTFSHIRPYMEQLQANMPPKEHKNFLSYQQEVPQALTFISGSVKKIDNLIEALLNLSRLGRKELKFEEINTKQLVQEQVQALSHQIKSGKIEVVVGDLPNVIADKVSLQQIFGNLIDNAIKYLDPNRRGKIEIYGNKDGDVVHFYVKDNGVGIQDKDRHKVFEIFKRINTVVATGEGMGLAFIKTLVKRHNGNIDFTSKFGTGTEFSFTIACTPILEEVCHV